MAGGALGNASGSMANVTSSLTSLCQSLRVVALNATYASVAAFFIFAALSYFIYTKKYSKSKSPAWLVALVICLLIVLCSGLYALGMIASYLFLPQASNTC